MSTRKPRLTIIIIFVCTYPLKRFSCLALQINSFFPLSCAEFTKFEVQLSNRIYLLFFVNSLPINHKYISEKVCRFFICFNILLYITFHHSVNLFLYAVMGSGAKTSQETLNTCMFLYHNHSWYPFRLGNLVSIFYEYNNNITYTPEEASNCRKWYII